MTIMTLPADVEAWAQAQVENGRFASVGAAIADAVRARALIEGDLGWAKPLLDEARRQAADGLTHSRTDVLDAVRQVIDRQRHNG